MNQEETMKYKLKRKLKKIGTFFLALLTLFSSLFGGMAGMPAPVVNVAAGKDGYEAGLENITGRENTSRSLSDVLIEYIQTKGKIIPRVDGRIKFTD